jgi:predicted PurR-regulated permease PerM
LSLDQKSSIAPDHRSRIVARAVFASALALLALWIARDFVASIMWAIIITTSLWPLYSRLYDHSKGPNSFAAAAFTVLVAVAIFLPIVLGLKELGEVQEPALQWIKQARESGIPVPSWIAQAPFAGEFVADLWQANLSDPQAVARIFAGVDTDSATGWLQAMGGNLLHRLLMFGFALLVLFFLLRDGRWIGRRVVATIEVFLGAAGKTLFLKSLIAMRGIVGGTVLVALIEGAVIGVAYVIAGVPKPFIFAILTTAFAMLPFGAWVAFGSASLLLATEGHSSNAALLFAWGAFVMIVGDHFLWPAVVGGAARLPFVLALIGIVGGLQTFGLVGLFAGPVVMAAVLTIWREWLGTRVGRASRTRHRRA